MNILLKELLYEVKTKKKVDYGASSSVIGRRRSVLLPAAAPSVEQNNTELPDKTRNLQPPQKMKMRLLYRLHKNSFLDSVNISLFEELGKKGPQFVGQFVSKTSTEMHLDSF